MISNNELQIRLSIVAYLDTFSFWQTDPWLFLTDDEHIAFTGGERVVDSILDMYDIEAAIVALTMGDDANTTHVATARYHRDNTSVKANEVGNLAGSNIDLDCVTDLNGRVWVANPTPPSVCSHISNQTLVQRLIEDATYVRASCVTKNGIPPRPSCTLLTLPSLYSASAASIR
jgi:hypothetical protein